MPRASDGTVTLVVGNPVVTDTDISADWANTTMADLAAMIEDSLSRSGDGGMLVPMLFANGNVGAPGIAFSNDVDTGIYLNAVGNMRAAVAGGDVLTLTATGAAVTGTLSVSGALTPTGGISGMTRASLPAVGQQVSLSSGNFSTSSTTYVDITNLTVTITTSGRPIILGLIPDGTANASGLVSQTTDATATVSDSYFKLFRGVSSISENFIQTIGAANVAGLRIGTPPLGCFFVDTPAAGTYTYKMQTHSGAAAYTISTLVQYVKLIAYEL